MEAPPTEHRGRGLYDKYFVERVNDPDGKHDECQYFVLDPAHDRFARTALYAYAWACEVEFPELARDLRSLANTGERIEFESTGTASGRFHSKGPTPEQVRGPDLDEPEDFPYTNEQVEAFRVASGMVACSHARGRLRALREAGIKVEFPKPRYEVVPSEPFGSCYVRDTTNGERVATFGETHPDGPRAAAIAECARLNSAETEVRGE